MAIAKDPPFASPGRARPGALVSSPTRISNRSSDRSGACYAGPSAGRTREASAYCDPAWKSSAPIDIENDHVAHTMGDRQGHRVASAARRIDESEIRNIGGRRQLEDATRNATVDDFLADKGRNVGPKLGVVFGQAGRRVPVHFPIDVGPAAGWIRLAGSGVGDQDARIAFGGRSPA
jgi:hypothetical protein